MSTVTGIAPGASAVAHGGRHAGADRTRAGALRVAAVFADHMVLQRDAPIAVFGTAARDVDVVVRLLRDGGDIVIAQSVAATPRDTASWTALLPPLPAGGPYTLDVRAGDDTLSYADIFIGEVWLAGGQSNIELELHTSEHGADAITAADDPLLRFYNTPKVGGVDEDAGADSAWCAAVAPEVVHMSAVGYYFGRRLRERLDRHVAVGIIDCYIGGTSISCWMSTATLNGSAAGRPYVERYEQAVAGKTDAQMRAEADAWQRTFDQWNNDVAAMRDTHPGITQPQIDAVLGPCPWPPPVTPFSERRVGAPFEGMVRRVAPYTVRGFLWYQGEEDELQCDSYRELLGLLIDEWRTLWNLDAYDEPTVGYQPSARTLPFLIVQLPQWIDGQVAAHGGDPRRWPVIRAAQYDASESIDDVELVCTMDCGEFDNIHPLDKRTVGERIANLALRTVYGDGDVAADSPRVVHTTVAGEAIDVMFDHARGLHWHGTTPDTMRGATDETGARTAGASGFEIAGDDGVYMDADAQILEYSGIDAADGEHMMVRVSSPQVSVPTAVRYAWRSWGPAPLFNGDGLPAFPYAG